MKFVHHPDYTCLTQAKAFDVGQRQLERYTFPFSGVAGDDTSIKTAVKVAIQQALESRANRGTNIGRMHVELDDDNPGTGRVVDVIARLEHFPAESVSDADLVPVVANASVEVETSSLDDAEPVEPEPEPEPEVGPGEEKVS